MAAGLVKRKRVLLPALLLSLLWLLLAGAASAQSTQDAALHNLELFTVGGKEVRIEEAVDPFRLSYTAKVGSKVDQVVVKPTARFRASTITINGNPVTSPVPLRFGENVLRIMITAPSGAQQTYTLTITREMDEDYKPTTPEPPSWGLRLPEEAAEDVVMRIGSAQATVDGKAVAIDAPPRIVDGRTLVPARFLAESLGATVTWDAATGVVTIAVPEGEIVMTIGSRQVQVGGKPRQIDVPPQIFDGRTYLPVRFLATAFGINVHYDDKTQQVRFWFERR